MAKAASNTEAKDTLKRVVLTLSGIRPILINTMTDYEVMALTKDLAPEAKNKVAALKQLPLSEQIRVKYELWRDPKTGKIGIWSHMLYAALVGAGKFIKYEGNMKLSTGKSSLVPSFLTIVDEHLPFTDQGSDGKGTPYVEDYRRGEANQSNGAVCVARPMIKDWAVDVEIDVETSLLDLTRTRDLFDKAGRMCRLGSFRTKSDFGSFRVADWVVMN